MQCSDNLVRTRLIWAWEQGQQPQLRLCLELGERGHYLYAVQPHSLFMGGIQFDVECVIEAQAVPQRAHAAEFHRAREHA